MKLEISEYHDNNWFLGSRKVMSHWSPFLVVKSIKRSFKLALELD